MSTRAFTPRGPRANVKRVGRRARLRQAKKLWLAAIEKRKAAAGHMPGAQAGTIEIQDDIAPSVEIDFSKMPTAFVAPSSNIRKDGGDDTENR
jgi:hypothetical protein